MLFPVERVAAIVVRRTAVGVGCGLVTASALHNACRYLMSQGHTLTVAGKQVLGFRAVGTDREHVCNMFTVQESIGYTTFYFNLTATHSSTLPVDSSSMQGASDMTTCAANSLFFPSTVYRGNDGGSTVLEDVVEACKDKLAEGCYAVDGVELGKEGVEGVLALYEHVLVGVGLLIQRAESALAV